MVAAWPGAHARRLEVDCNRLGSRRACVILRGEGWQTAVLPEWCASSCQTLSDSRLLPFTLTRRRPIKRRALATSDRCPVRKQQGKWVLNESCSCQGGAHCPSERFRTAKCPRPNLAPSQES